jgi:hypothetical protein
LGDNYRIRTEFCILKSKEEQEDEIIKMDLLCFTLGSCVILFDEQIHNLSVMEVQKQVEKKMIAEHNAISQA